MIKLVLGLVVLFYTLPSMAILEIRGGYGLSQPKTSFGTGVEIGKVDGFHGDLIVEPPLTNFGFGIRYEKLGYDIESATVISPTDFERISVIINYRIIDIVGFFGFIGTVGFSNKMTIENYDNTGQSELFSNDYNFTYGVEGGVNLALFQIGLELGYFQGGDFAPENAAITPPEPLNIDGLYGKVSIGLSF